MGAALLRRAELACACAATQRRHSAAGTKPNPPPPPRCSLTEPVAATMALKFVALVASLAAAAAQAHRGSWLADPAPRSRADVTGHVEFRGPCDAPYTSAQAPARVVTPGSSLALKWPRNGRAGGMVRVAWAPADFSSSDAAATVFDLNVASYSCFEASCSATTGCNAGDITTGCDACSHTVQVPPFPSGAYTLQWCVQHRHRPRRFPAAHAARCARAQGLVRWRPRSCSPVQLRRCCRAQHGFHRRPCVPMAGCRPQHRSDGTLTAPTPPSPPQYRPHSPLETPVAVPHVACVTPATRRTLQGQGRCSRRWQRATSPPEPGPPALALLWACPGSRRRVPPALAAGGARLAAARPPTPCATRRS